MTFSAYENILIKYVQHNKELSLDEPSVNICIFYTQDNN